MCVCDREKDRESVCVRFVCVCVCMCVRVHVHAHARVCVCACVRVQKSIEESGSCSCRLYMCMNHKHTNDILCSNKMLLSCTQFWPVAMLIKSMRHQWHYIVDQPLRIHWTYNGVFSRRPYYCATEYRVMWRGVLAWLPDPSAFTSTEKYAPFYALQHITTN